jgi:hypothetical protein
MKTFLAIALFYTTQAFAFGLPQFETSLGVTDFMYAHDGSTWYQDPFPHTLRTVSPSLQFGVTDKFGPVRLHTGYEYLGKVSSDAIAATGADFDFTCPTAHWHGKGSAQGFYGNGEYEVETHGYTFGAGFGIFVYRPTWTENIPDFTYCGKTPRVNMTVTHNAKWQQTPTLSLSAAPGSNALVLTYLHHVTAENDSVPALYDIRRNYFLGKMGLYGDWNLSLRHVF